MNRAKSFKWRLPTGISLAAIAAAAYLTAIAPLMAADSKPPKTAKPAKPDKKNLTGADLYAIHCNRCHAERYATERTDAQWKTIMMHMRVRAQLPGKDAKAILKYLQENN